MAWYDNYDELPARTKSYLLRMIKPSWWISRGTAVVGAASLGFLGHNGGELINQKLEITNNVARIALDIGATSAGATAGLVAGGFLGLYTTLTTTFLVGSMAEVIARRKASKLEEQIDD